MNITAGMPVKPYLKRYVYWKENQEENTIFDLNVETPIRMMLFGLLVGKLKVHTQPRKKEKISKRYTDEIVCRVPTNREARELLFYNVDRIIFFNRFVYKEMHEDLLYMIMLNMINGIEENVTIQAFMESAGIEDLIELDTLKKASYRLRKSRNLPVFHKRECRTALNPYVISVTGEKT